MDLSQSGAARVQENTAPAGHLHQAATWVPSQCPGVLADAQWKPPVSSGQSIVLQVIPLCGQGFFTRDTALSSMAQMILEEQVTQLSSAQSPI